MTSKEIIINLLNEQKITGEEAYTLIHDIVRNEYYYPYYYTQPNITLDNGTPSYSIKSN